jgi:hypothetical protein
MFLADQLLQNLALRILSHPDRARRTEDFTLATGRQE